MAEIETILSDRAPSDGAEVEASDSKPEAAARRQGSNKAAWKQDEEPGDEEPGDVPQAKKPSGFFGSMFGRSKKKKEESEEVESVEGASEEDAPVETEEPARTKSSLFKSIFSRRTKSSGEEEAEDEGQGSEEGDAPKRSTSGDNSPIGRVTSNKSGRIKTGGSRPKSSAASIRSAVNQSSLATTMRIFRGLFFRDKAMDRAETVETDQEEVTLKALQDRVYRVQKMVMLTAIISLLSGVAVNEWCWLGYIPEPEEEIGFCTDTIYTDESSCRSNGFNWNDGMNNPLDAEDGGYCNDGFGNTLKGVSTTIVVILQLMIFYLYECIAVELCMRNHLEYRKDFVNIPFWELGLLPSYAVEGIICFIHTAPGITSLIEVEARGRVAFYNIESVLVAVMFLRVYNVWRFYREWLFHRYTSKTFASRLNDVPMDSKLAIKAILDDRPFQTIAFVFALSMLVLAYLVRIAESPVNVQHLYFWNQLWLVVVTATSTGYGDLYPISHLGRLFCFIAMLVGIVLTAVLIASVSSKLALNASEARLMNFLQSERWEKEIKIAATSSIQSWWRRSLQHPKTLSALRHFRNQKRQYRKFLDATPHFGAFVDKMKEENTRVSETLEKIEMQVQGGIPGAPARPNRRAAGAGAASLLSGGQPIAQKAFDELMMEMAQLKKSNQQLQGIIESGQLQGMGSTGPSVASIPMGGLQAMHAAGSQFRLGKNQEPALVASQAVEERVRRLENEIQNFDKGMAKVLGQVVRLLQGLY